jgi:hypothetical protein
MFVASRAVRCVLDMYLILYYIILCMILIYSIVLLQRIMWLQSPDASGYLRVIPDETHGPGARVCIIMCYNIMSKYKICKYIIPLITTTWNLITWIRILLYSLTGVSIIVQVRRSEHDSTYSPMYNPVPWTGGESLDRTHVVSMWWTLSRIEYTLTCKIYPNITKCTHVLTRIDIYYVYLYIN